MYRPRTKTKTALRSFPIILRMKNYIWTSWLKSAIKWFQIPCIQPSRSFLTSGLIFGRKSSTSKNSEVLQKKNEAPFFYYFKDEEL